MTMSVLVVEDNRDAQYILEKLLMSMGINPVLCSQGDHALNYLAENTPQIVLLDMNLPVVDGEEVLDYIRTYSHLKDTVVVVISADYQMSMSNYGKADYVLMKPVQPRQLKTLLYTIQATLPVPAGV